MKQTRTLGFTLVELLVAIAIFAVLSALGWRIFDYLNKVKDRNAEHESHLIALQEAYLQFQRDTLQIVPLNANIAGQVNPAFVLENHSLEFSKAGVTDPLKQGLSPFERIEYKYNEQEKKLYRYKYSNLNVMRTSQPLSSVVLDEIEAFEIYALNPEQQSVWPEPDDSDSGANQLAVQTASRFLPKGMIVKFKQRDVEYEWVFSLLNTEFLKSMSMSSTNQNSNNGQNNNGNQNSNRQDSNNVQN